MAQQLLLTTYVNSFQSAIKGIVPSTIPVYNKYDPNKSNDPTFIIWDLSDVHQEVYTGDKSNKGIDKPIFDISVCGSSFESVLLISDNILNAWHGFRGSIGSLVVNKIDINVVGRDYIDKPLLQIINMQAQFWVSVPSS